jgi:hypothetical protein
MAAKYPGCATHLQDGANAPDTTFDNIRGVIYAEISLLCGSDGASMYNTSGLNNQANPDDTAPADLWNNVSEDATAKQYQVPSAWKNGPRGWTADKIEVPVGTELDFNGLKARWFAYPEYPPDLLLKHAGITVSEYKDTSVQRKSVIYFTKGRPLFILEDPDGNPWVMQAWSSQIDTSLTYDDLANLAPKLTLPTGWAYRVVNAKQDLKIVPVNGIATITQDSLGNSYDECTSKTCNYIP